MKVAWGVEHVVSAVVVVVVSIVILVLAGVPNVCEAGHGCGLLAVDLVEEGGINCAAVYFHAVAVQLEGIGEEAFVACHDVGQIAEGLGGVAFGSNVDVNTAASGGVALYSCMAELAAKLLKGFDIGVSQNRGDQFASLFVGAVDAGVPGEFPFPTLCIPCAPCEISVAVGGEFVASGSKKGGCHSGGVLAGDVVHLNLNPDGLLLHLGDLISDFLGHGVTSVKVCVFFWCTHVRSEWAKLQVNSEAFTTQCFRCEFV